MSFEAMAWAIKQKTGSPVAKMILLCLANYADDDSTTFSSQKLISEQAEVSLRAVRNNIRILETKGLLSREPRRRVDGTKTTDLITLPVQAALNAASHSPSGTKRPIKRHLVPDYKDEPITYPITKGKALKNGGRNQDREPQRTEKVAKGFQSLSASLAKVVPSGKPDRRKQAQGAAA